ncbi:unnamed protein product [Cuscuta epithymum]|uniref:Uncharacterized protein n=1 Tax=Cuscuta epithymum TaxID=186058 RepID=A0AAV0FXZ1_9ASTE|nr:unnamed protein product [Cuscuta epithymum]
MWCSKQAAEQIAEDRVTHQRTPTAKLQAANAATLSLLPPCPFSVLCAAVAAPAAPQHRVHFCVPSTSRLRFLSLPSAKPLHTSFRSGRSRHETGGVISCSKKIIY